MSRIPALVLVFVALTLAALIATVAEASPPDGPVACAESFPHRLADAKRAIAEHTVYTAEFGRVMPWYFAHCRQLSERERIVRKIDDEAAFVCDTNKGRPAELTSTFVATHSAELGIEMFQTAPHESDLCEPFDRVARVSLVLRDPSPVHKLEVMCWGDERPSCVEARTAIAAARAKGRER